VEYPALPSTVDCGGVVGFILTLKGQVFSLILYKQHQTNGDSMPENEQISRRAQLRALLRVAKYRPKLTFAIIVGGIFAALLD